MIYCDPDTKQQSHLTADDMKTVAFVLNNRGIHVVLGDRLRLVLQLALAGF